jgi:predicted dehydrogenase
MSEQEKGMKRYVQVGMGGRSWMYSNALSTTYRETCELVGICDPNQTRMDYCNERLADSIGAVPTYKADQFDRMVEERKPQWVIVTTKDCHHHEYIVRAMELGCDVVTEKPMTTDAEKCQQILDTKARTGRRVIVSFNYRYAPIRAAVRQAIAQGKIGRVRSVDFTWMLDKRHGADYFRRWHRHKENSGGLLVHKASHHFDLVNWWIDSRPELVFAQGARTYALPEQAEKLGLTGRGERCRTCALTEKCPYYLDLDSKEKLQRMYLEAEHEDGYFRDRCVFDPSIDIEDQMSLSVRYRNGAFLTYSLVSFLPYEGYRVAVNGTEGRLESVVGESSYVSGDGSVQGRLLKESRVTIFPLFGDPYDVEIATGGGGHGGGDVKIVDDIFADEPSEDPLGRAATEVDGAYSILTGIAANQSIATGGPINIDSLVRLPG